MTSDLELLQELEREALARMLVMQAAADLLRRLEGLTFVRVSVCTGSCSLNIDIGFGTWVVPPADDATLDPPLWPERTGAYEPGVVVPPMSQAEDDLLPDAQRGVEGDGAAVIPRTLWSSAEIDRARCIIEGGGTGLDVARVLKRPRAGVLKKLQVLRKQWADEIKQAADKPAPEPIVPPPAPAPVEAEPAPKVERPSSLWNPATDLELVEALIRGEKLRTVAAMMEIGIEDCRARWKQLCPKSTLDARKALLARLRGAV